MRKEYYKAEAVNEVILFIMRKDVAKRLLLGVERNATEIAKGMDQELGLRGLEGYLPVFQYSTGLKL